MTGHSQQLPGCEQIMRFAGTAIAWRGRDRLPSQAEGRNAANFHSRSARPKPDRAPCSGPEEILRPLVDQSRRLPFASANRMGASAGPSRQRRLGEPFG